MRRWLNRLVEVFVLMTPLDLVRLTPLMKLTSGIADVSIGLVDGPVVMNHPALASQHVREISENGNSACTQINSVACMHGTFIAGILSARRGSSAPAICPGCTVLMRPIFAEAITGHAQLPSATPEELAAAVIECIVAGARCINLSLALAHPSSKGERELQQVLDYAAKRGVIIVAAAGNQGTLGSSAITRHSWVIPVVACDLRGRPMNESNLGSSIGRWGLSAPGDRITSLGSDGQSSTFGGTSVAVPFVTGAIALLWSEFPSASAAQIKLAVTQTAIRQRASIVPTLLDAAAAHQALLTAKTRRRTA